MPTELLDRFEKLLPGHRELGEDLLRCYAEPHRRYHTAAHLAGVLDAIDRLAGPEADLFVVRLAAWFHDAVYAVPPGQKGSGQSQVSNEEASARLAIRTLGRAGLEQEDLNEVVRLVRLTETHRPGPRDPNGDLLCDADLAVLASPPQEYAAYVAAVRAEHPATSDEDFARGRLAVLLRLRVATLFRTGRGHRLEWTARANLDAELAALASRLGIDLADFDPDVDRPT